MIKASEVFTEEDILEIKVFCEFWEADFNIVRYIPEVKNGSKDGKDM